ncbi:signal transduction histidine kinase [Thermus oshimai JL-2]|uniref:histidine kinase n=1 Tax=Thermus oshimai JL-2 TaxID=751945 RepID=K7RFU5_THEOS|nr:HAMP domain-containing sensor histidine kinase [Thermus oshimai]AFV75427.1 signal transduction histidine kinase [Thermus oshimai JL-2]
MATGFRTLRARLLLLLLLSLLLLAFPLALLTAKEAEKAASEDLRRALLARLFLLKEEGPGEEEALLAELLRLAQTFGGGVGFVVGEGVRYTDLSPPPLPEALFQALGEGRPYQGVHAGGVAVALPRGEGGFGLWVPLEGVAGLGRRLLLLWATWGGGVLLLVFLLGVLGLRLALRPLEGLARELARRSPQDLSPLPPPGIEELRPVVEALNRLFREVDRLLKELSEKEALSRRFAQHASHELRTPLAALKGHLEILRRHPGESRALEGALRALERMEGVLGGLLRLVRLEATPPRRVPLDLRAFLEGFGLEVEGEGRAFADPDLLALAVENVLENARRHGALPVRAFLEEDEGGVWIRLLDSGPGFPEPLLPQAFQPFAHGGRGTGLGLALVAAVARAHGGRAVAENRGGALVGLHLPLGSLKEAPGAPFGEVG